MTRDYASAGGRFQNATLERPVCRQSEPLTLVAAGRGAPALDGYTLMLASVGV